MFSKPLNANNAGTSPSNFLHILRDSSLEKSRHVDNWTHGHVHINTEYQNVSKSLVRGWSWHRLRRITGQLVFYYGQITASLIQPPATASSEAGYLASIKLHNSCLIIRCPNIRIQQRTNLFIISGHCM